MSEIIALSVRFIPIKNNFVYLHSKLLPKFENSSNHVGCVKIKHNESIHYGSCYSSPFNTNGENAFNISAAYANSLSIKEHETVIISSVAHLKSLKSVCVTPHSSDDWDILENSAESIQSSLLNQIRVISAHQNLVIWVSKSISLTIHIDQLNDDNQYGKLEPYSEVIVSTEIKSCTVCTLENNIHQRSNNTWNFSFFKDIFSLIHPKEKSTEEEEPNQGETEFSSLGVFRCSPTNALQFDVASELLNYPYNVFISKKHIKNDSILDRRRSCILCRLSHTEEIYVHLFILEDIAHFVPDAKFHIRNSYPTIFFSDTISQVFNYVFNVKVKLEIVKKPISVDVTEIDFYLLNSNSLDISQEKTLAEMKKSDPLTFNDDASTCQTREPEYIAKLKSFVSSYTLARDTIVINNYRPHLKFFDDIIYFSFNPANVPFLEMSYSDFERCQFKFVVKKIDEPNRTDEPLFDTNLLQFSFFQSIFVELRSIILLELGLLRRCNNKTFVTNSNHVIIEGDRGSGKTSVVNLLSGFIRPSYGVYVKIIECKSLKGKLVSKLKTVFESVLNECVRCEPSILIFDDLDVLFVASKQNDQQHAERSVASYTNRLSVVLCDLIRSYSSYQITVLATATNLSSFESNLYQARGASVFSVKLRVPELDQDMRRDTLIQLLIHKYNVVIPQDVTKSEYMDGIVQRLEGYCIQDIADLADRIYFETIKRQVKTSLKLNPPVMHQEDIDQAISQVIPMSLKGVDFHKNSSITWKHIGGLETAKQLLTEILIWPSKYPKVFTQCPLKMQSGVLLYGAPGCGKTLLASAVAGESLLNFISIKGPELLSKYVGESEEGVRNIFRKAQNAKPCLLFFDEFESLAPRRGNDITGVTDRVVNQLLTELDGVESISGVWILAATSRPDLIDPALLRPGRLGSMVYCPLPSQKDRLSILKMICVSTEMDADVDLNVIAQVTDGFTGADLQAVLYTAHMHCEKAGTGINMETLLNSVKETNPSLKPGERLLYEKIYQRFSHRDEKINVELEKQRLTFA